MFVAFGISPIEGVDGIMGMCATDRFPKHSVLQAIKESKGDFDTEFMHLSFNHTKQYSRAEGFLKFLSRKEFRKMETMTFAGYIELDTQLENIDLEVNNTVNPFIVVGLSQIDFSAALL